MTINAAPILAAICLCCLSGTALAAPKLVGSDPGAGEHVIIRDNQIYLQFSEAVDPKRSTIEVTDEKNRIVSRGLSQEAGDLKGLDVNMKAPVVMGYEQGQYSVRWVVTAPNGEVSSGSFNFHVMRHH